MYYFCINQKQKDMTINITNDSKLIDTDITTQSDWDLSSETLIEEGYMSFQIGEDTIDINLIINVCGYEEYNEGDYWTAPSSRAEIESIEIEIKEVYLNEDEIKVSDDLKNKLKKLVESNF